MRRDQGRGSAADEVERLLAEHGDRLMRVAISLTSERADAEDLMQAALERLVRHRRTVTIDTEAYVRRTLYNLAADGWRRQGVWRRKIPLLRTERASAGTDPTADAIAAVDLQDALVELLLRLPPHQRAVIVLRYWEQLSAAEAAEVLGCSEATVKSAAAKGLRRLRELAGSWPDAETGPGRNGQTGAAPDNGADPEQRVGRTSEQKLIGMARERS